MAGGPTFPNTYEKSAYNKNKKIDSKDTTPGKEKMPMFSVEKDLNNIRMFSSESKKAVSSDKIN